MEVTASSLWHHGGRAWVSWFSGLPRGTGRLSPGGWLALSGEPVVEFNFAYVDDRPAAAEQLRAFAEVIGQQRLSAIVLVAGSASDRLAPTAAQLGLQRVGSVPLMTRAAETSLSGAWQDTGRYHIDQATTPEDFAAVAGLLSATFGLPRDPVERILDPSTLAPSDVTMFLARRDGQPVSTVLTTGSGEVIGLWNMGTAPEVQRQGAGRALLEATMAYHQARGARLFYLGATDVGKPLYERMGFRTLEEAAVWVLGQTPLWATGEISQDRDPSTPAGNKDSWDPPIRVQQNRF